MNLRVKRVKETYDAHVQCVVRHRRVAVLGHDQIYAHELRISRSRLKAEQCLREDLLLGEAPQNLAEIADLDMAGGSRVRLHTAFTLQSESFSLVEARLGKGHVVAQSVRQQFVAQLVEIVMPADFSGDCRGVTEVWRVHQLEILFILCGSPSGDLIDPFAEMAMIGTAESREGIEEVIMPGHPGRRHKTSHGESIHERVKEMLVFVSVCRRDFPVSAGLLRSAARRALRLRESELGNIDAQMIFGCGADPGFRVNSTAKMIVQISALRHAEQKVTELKRILPRGLELDLGALF